ncbi:DNA primase [Streptomyces sp. 130]|uniref:DNA primase family protein n=1 Tax=Streptomyces sp. 130 TaxID=2591006 RepID=UPI0011811BEA|nr:phage/plasmid primase, P4 family [Streptomyces sp. 130]TRV75594.1 DNA primase [Streptomyces sp. 130]
MNEIGHAGAAGRLLPESLTDCGNARLFVDVHRHRLRYVRGLGWYSWQGHRWSPARSEEALLWAAGDMAEQLAESDPSGSFAAEDLVAHKRRTLSTPGMKALLTQVRTLPGLAVEANDLDSDPYALCTPSGVVDLRTGHLEPPDPARHLHSRATAVTPRPEATPRWHRFLTETFGSDPEGRRMIDYLQLLLGYSITGDVGTQILPFLWGTGRNGKSVLLSVVMHVLGGYADSAPPGILTDRGPSGPHPAELVELHGRRLVVCHEPRADDTFDEARVRRLTGGEHIRAHRMRQDVISFAPTHHLWLIGNSRPQVSAGGLTFWRRIRLLPFERTVPAERVISNLASQIADAEGPGVLQWLMDGARRHLASPTGLFGPERVRHATAGYAATEDHIGRFLQERHLPQRRPYAHYKAWCTEEGFRPAPARVFHHRARDRTPAAA